MALWRYREARPEAIDAVELPVNWSRCRRPAVDLAQAAIHAALAAAARVIVVHHLAESNPHVTFVAAEDPAEQVTDAVLRSVATHVGSIGAAHGIGHAQAR